MNYDFYDDMNNINDINSFNYETKIAGKVNNYLITMDNDVIDISTIKDVIYQAYFIVNQSAY